MGLFTFLALKKKLKYIRQKMLRLCMISLIRIWHKNSVANPFHFDPDPGICFVETPIRVLLRIRLKIEKLQLFYNFSPNYPKIIYHYINIENIYSSG